MEGGGSFSVWGGSYCGLNEPARVGDVEKERGGSFGIQKAMLAMLIGGRGGLIYGSYCRLNEPRLLEMLAMLAKNREAHLGC